MKRELTNTGWVETITTNHKITLAESIMTVGKWNEFNVQRPEIGKNRGKCERCHTAWVDLPFNQNVNICMMEKEVNRCICDKCLSEIDQKLVLK